jgi:hypothetical protein
MTDLLITVSDENRNVCLVLEIYEDGSDSEALDTIREALGEKFESISEHML